jgi:beta-mannosidase
MKRQELHDGWTVEPGAVSDAPGTVAEAGPIPASVPGSVHTDLLAAGLIDDPYLDDNEARQAWIGVTDWIYRRPIGWAEDGSERQELVFDGLDTVATVRLDGAVLGATRNMHRSYRFDVTGRIGADGELEVAFEAPIRAADAASLELGYRPHVNHHPYNGLRKMACSFGWDWGPDTSTSGIWRGARLETWSTARIAELRVVPAVTDGVPTLSVAVRVERAGTDAGALDLVIRMAGLEARAEFEPGAELAAIELPVPDAELWWPVGHGAQPLYDVDVELRAEALVLDAARRRIGFRTVSIDTTPDSEGVPFTLVVNGEPVFVRGANWIPDDAFPHRVDRARYAERLDQAQFAGINLIRVWGGGIYESDSFYAECDERGLLVWQDFLLACAAYAEEKPMRSEIEAEAREAVLRLGPHPSLVLLNGNNENIWGYQEWNWQPRLDGRTWGSYYYYEAFPRIVEELAPHVAYTPGSPFSPDRDAAQNDPAQGSMHIWDLWNSKDYLHYRDYRPRFVAEFGWQGPPTWSSLTAAVSDSPLTPESPGMLVHQKAMEGNVKLIDGLVPHFALPDDMEDWHWAMSLNQAVAIRTGIEWFRSLTPHCSGTVVWQLNDCWPVTSWAAIDGYGRRKPLLFALRQAYAERLVTIQPDGDGVAVVAVNDTAEAWAGVLELTRTAYTGETLARDSLVLEIPARGTVRVPVVDAIGAPSSSESEVLVAQLGTVRATWFFADYRHSELAAPDLDVRAEADHGDWRVDVTARNLVRDLFLQVDKVAPDAVVDRGLVTLLPGESVRFTIRGAESASGEDFARVVRCANDLVAVGT